jgi:hypothetical protein
MCFPFACVLTGLSTEVQTQNKRQEVARAAAHDGRMAALQAHAHSVTSHLTPAAIAQKWVTPICIKSFVMIGEYWCRDASSFPNTILLL